MRWIHHRSCTCFYLFWSPFHVNKDFNVLRAFMPSCTSWEQVFFTLDNATHVRGTQTWHLCNQTAPPREKESVFIYQQLPEQPASSSAFVTLSLSVSRLLNLSPFSSCFPLAVCPFSCPHFCLSLFPSLHNIFRHSTILSSSHEGYKTRQYKTTLLERQEAQCPNL